MIRTLVLSLALVGGSYAGGFSVSGGSTIRVGENLAAEVSSIDGPVYVAHKFGSNQAIANTSREDIWSASTAAVKPYLDLAGGSTITISSDDANDTAAGSGARTVKVLGYTSANLWAEETATLNGQTGVTLSTDYVRIVRQQVMTVGAGMENAGTIYVGTGNVSAGIPAVVVSQIEAGVNQTQQTHMSVPDGWTGYLHGYDISSSKNDEFQVRIMIRKNTGTTAGPWRVTHEELTYNSHVSEDFGSPIRITGPADIKIDGLHISGSGKKRVFGNYELWMFKD